MRCGGAGVRPQDLRLKTRPSVVCGSEPGMWDGDTGGASHVLFSTWQESRESCLISRFNFISTPTLFCPVYGIGPRGKRNSSAASRIRASFVHSGNPSVSSQEAR